MIDLESFQVNKSTWRLFTIPVAAHLFAGFRRHVGRRLAYVIHARQNTARAHPPAREPGMSSNFFPRRESDHYDKMPHYVWACECKIFSEGLFEIGNIFLFKYRFPFSWDLINLFLILLYKYFIVCRSNAFIEYFNKTLNTVSHGDLLLSSIWQIFLKQSFLKKTRKTDEGKCNKSVRCNKFYKMH